MIPKIFSPFLTNRFFALIVIMGVFVYGGFNLFQTHETLHSVAQEEMLMLYKLSKKIANLQVSSLRVENEMYENQKEFFDEYQKITPYIVEKESQSALPFTLSIRFFTQDTLLEPLLAQLKALETKAYVCTFNESSLSLFGKIDTNTFIFIQKESKHFQRIVHEVERLTLSLSIVVFLTLSALAFAYYEALLYRRKKEILESEYLYLKEDAKKLAFVDALTGVSSRLKLSQSLSDLVENAKRFYQPFSLILCDLDHFKRINDTYGHDYGDVVLKEVAKTLQNTLRNSDIIARWGGEEFVMVLPMAHLKSAIKTAEKLRRNICALSFEKIPYVTCSFGVVLYQIGEDEEALFKRVDTLLYEAKKAGRNCIKYEKKG